MSTYIVKIIIYIYIYIFNIFTNIVLNVVTASINGLNIISEHPRMFVICLYPPTYCIQNELLNHTVKIYIINTGIKYDLNLSNRENFNLPEP